MTTGVPPNNDPPSTVAFVRERLHAALVAPVRAFRWAYLPLLMIYFAYGALGITAIADSFWVKNGLTLSAAQLAQIGVWLTLPWTIKMVFGELVDTVPVFGSRRRIYVLIGAALVATSLLILAGAAAKLITFAKPETIYFLASLMTVIGVVLQDVVADAMSTEVVPHFDDEGKPREQAEIDRDLGMVQVLGRLSLSLGVFLTAGLAGWLAQSLPYATVFLIGLLVPLISVTGALTVRLEPGECRPTDWRILGGGLVFGATVVILGVSDTPFKEEIVFMISMAVVILMLARITSEIEAVTKQRIISAAILIFAFRATPSVGSGFQWYSIDRLGFDEAFFGTLGQFGALIALLATWLFADAITRQPVARVLFWLTVLGTVLAIPGLLLAFDVHHWTERMVGVGARAIAVIDTAATSPFAQLGIIPLLTLTAIYAPRDHRATWFALMGSLMNLALVAGQLLTKYLNEIYVVERGSYGQLPALVVAVAVIGLVLPLTAILGLGRRVR